MLNAPYHPESEIKILHDLISNQSLLKTKHPTSSRLTSAATSSSILDDYSTNIKSEELFVKEKEVEGTGMKDI